MMNSEKLQQTVVGYCDAVGDLLASDIVQQMRRYPHHKTVSTFWHSVYVSYLTYRVCGGLHLQQREAARAALLHDFYLYNWYVEKHGEYHIWYHPKTCGEKCGKVFRTVDGKTEKYDFKPYVAAVCGAAEIERGVCADLYGQNRCHAGFAGTVSAVFTHICVH